MNSLARALAAMLAILCSTSPAQERQPLWEAAATFIDIAESSRDTNGLWGRIAGSDAEHEAAEVLRVMLKPHTDTASIESFEFDVYRPAAWTLASRNGDSFASAMPLPAGSRSVVTAGTFPVILVAGDGDWSRVGGAWAFIEADMSGNNPARNTVRQNDLYARAVEAGARGLIFSLPTPPGAWRVVPPLDKPFAQPDEHYPDKVRPIPAFCVSSDDGKAIRGAAEREEDITFSIEYHSRRIWEGRNAVATLDAGAERNILLLAHLDSYFSGANDDASGLAVLVGLAEKLNALPRSSRAANFIFAGVSAHHDEAAGMRDFIERRPGFAASLDAAILLEHLDAVPGDDSDAGWTLPLNNFRAVYAGTRPWPIADADIQQMTQTSGLMTTPPPVLDRCIADLFVICSEAPTFSLMQAPPYYHSNHDTRDKLTEQGLQNALNFHWQLLAKLGSITP